MVWISPDDEKRLDSVQWLHGAFMRGIQVDVERKDVALYAVADESLVELLCEDAIYAAVPNLFDWKELPAHGGESVMNGPAPTVADGAACVALG